MDDVTFADIYSLITPDQDVEDDSTQLDYELPEHQRCATHTLNLVATSDVDKHLSSDSLSRSVYRSSTVASDHVQETLKRKLVVPCATQWNSHYNAVLRVVENLSAELNELCISVELRCFTERELSFLKEYCAVLKPLLNGLDILQGEDRLWFPTAYIRNNYQKTKATKTGLSCMTTSLVDAVESAIRRRFSHVFESRNAIIAAVTLPKFKLLKWVKLQETKDSYKQMLLEEMRTQIEEDEHLIEKESAVEARSKEKRKDFYEFDT